MYFYVSQKKKLPIDLEEVPVVWWRRKKIVNEKTGKEVFENSATGKRIKELEKYKLRSSCPDGYRYDFKKGKCVKLTQKEIKEREMSPRKKLEPCPTGTIRNPITKRCVSIYSTTGQQILSQKMEVNYNKNFMKLGFY